MHNLLIKYLNNQCNSEEADQVLRYLQTPDGQRHLERIMSEEAGSLNQITDREPNYDQIFSKIHSAIEVNSASAKVIPLYRRWYAVAAAVSTLLLVATWWFLLQPAPPEVYQTAYGETQTIKLNDGSVVTLNANSILKVATNDDIREVWLTGEAFFEIEEVLLNEGNQGHAELVKFVVHTQELDVVVVGTTFNVQNRDEKTQVVLNSGKVWLEADTEKLVMEPGEVAERTSQGKMVKTTTVNPSVYSAWKENKLVCRNTTLAEIAEVIYHRFGHTAEFANDSIRSLSITGTLPLHQLPLLTETLQESLNITIQYDGQTLVFEKK
ncbi:MAG: FecR domain-containing protein [Tunicatimonas sp.]|uniref:FecR family protein n=1 Tax=Tunicatimonas sp. TaxID=1940096 RepID=UPI003C748E0C